MRMAANDYEWIVFVSMHAELLLMLLPFEIWLTNDFGDCEWIILFYLLTEMYIMRISFLLTIFSSKPASKLMIFLYTSFALTFKIFSLQAYLFIINNNLDFTDFTTRDIVHTRYHLYTLAFWPLRQL